MYFSNTEHDKNMFHSILEGIKSKTIGVTSGCFDILHPLHIQYLEKCRAQCECLIVGVDSDRLIEECKHKVPVYSEHDRAFMVSSLVYANLTFVMDDIGILAQVLSTLRHAYKESDIHLYKSQMKYYNEPVLRVQGVSTIHIPDVYPINSTTDLIKHIQQEYQKL